MKEDRVRLIEEVVSAFRDQTPTGVICLSSAWLDLSIEERETAASEAQFQRMIEASLDPEGRSTTVQAVLARIYEDL